MEHDERPDVAGRTKAFLIDAASLAVVWMNDAAASDPVVGDVRLPAPLSAALPVAEALGAAEAVRDVAASGSPRHLHADLVSTVRGSMAIVASLSRLPDGAVLLLLENAWKPHHEKAPQRRSKSPGSRR